MDLIRFLFGAAAAGNDAHLVQATKRLQNCQVPRIRKIHIPSLMVEVLFFIIRTCCHEFMPHPLSSTFTKSPRHAFCQCLRILFCQASAHQATSVDFGTVLHASRVQTFQPTPSLRPIHTTKKCAQLRRTLYLLGSPLDSSSFAKYK